jgi:molybdenum cofactor guanylyltransferase
MDPPLVGIFLGGRAQRMGGFPKGNLLVDGRSILERTLEACREVVAPRGVALYLVGESSAYAASGVLRLADDPAGVGPMGGLRALLKEASATDARVIALAGDMPFLTRAILGRLFDECPGAAALAPREGPRWQPLFARYRPSVVLPIVDRVLARGETSLQAIFDTLGNQAVVLELTDLERGAIVDWDRPSDVNPLCPDSSR